MSPLFIYRCRDEKCKHEQEEIRPIAKVYSPTYCNVCGQAMENIIARPAKMIRGQGGWSSPAPKG
jgi:predicted nucleic acid-binding Zn ribbon protein